MVDVIRGHRVDFLEVRKPENWHRLRAGNCAHVGHWNDQVFPIMILIKLFLFCIEFFF